MWAKDGQKAGRQNRSQQQKPRSHAAKATGGWGGRRADRQSEKPKRKGIRSEKITSGTVCRPMGRPHRRGMLRAHAVDSTTRRESLLKCVADTESGTSTSRPSAVM